MLDRQLIRTEPDKVRAGAARKGIEAPVDEFLAVDGERRQEQVELNQLQAELNQTSKSIGQLRAQGKMEEFEAARALTGQLKETIRVKEELMRGLDEKLGELELKFPNLPHESVPDGMTAEENVVVRSWGSQEPNPHAIPHWEICAELGLADFERGVKVSGSGFVVYTGAGARLVRSLINFFVDRQTDAHGYREVWAPAVVNSRALIGTGNLPKFEDDLYKIDDDAYLIPTAEVPVTNLHAGEILSGDDLPVRYAAYTPCFRREAGAAGRDTRGIQRMHQFDKVELVRFEKPEDSYDALEELTGHAEAMLKELELPYRVLLLCAGDMGDKGCKCYDLEALAPAEQKWLEVSSCTNFEAYQARRADIRFRREQGGKPEFVHILNGSGLAIPRVLIALLENGRQADGSVVLPQALHRYFGAERITRS
jgi:seryl-tRNA synthetase